MNDILKQRLVGALILVALGVVFWPIIFVEPGQQVVVQQPRIPPPPGVATEPIAAPDLVGLRASPQASAGRETVLPPPTAEPAAPAPVAQNKAPPAAPEPAPTAPSEPTRAQAPEKLAMDSDGVPIAWILQVASVSSEDKADALRQRLLEMEQKAYVKRVRRGSSDLYRVYIGPKFERARLESLQAQIDAEFGVTSMVVRYIP